MNPPSNSTAGLRSFATVDRFIAEATGKTPRAGYVLLGDDAFLLQRARQRHSRRTRPPRHARLLPARSRPRRHLHLRSARPRADALADGALPGPLHPQPQNALRPRQKKDEFAAIDDYFRRPNPQALLIFVADHLRLPTTSAPWTDQDKERDEKIRETLGDGCGIVELQRVNENDAINWAIRDAEVPTDSPHRRRRPRTRRRPRRRDAQLSSELSKTPPLRPIGPNNSQTIELADVETMVPAAKQRSLYELTDAISLKDAPAPSPSCTAS